MGGPLTSLVRISQAQEEPIGPLQPLAVTDDDFVAAAAAVGMGVTIEDAVLKKADPYRDTAAFQIELSELLLGRDFDEAENAYYFEPGTNDVLKQDGEFEILGSNLAGDAFTVTVLGIGESDFSGLSPDEQAVLDTVGIERGWGVECVLATPLGSAIVSGMLIHGEYGSTPIWRFFPTVDMNGAMMENAIASHAVSAAAPAQVQVPSDPSQVDVACAEDCRSDYNLCKDLAQNQYESLMAGAAAVLAAALGACATLSVLSIWVPGIGAVAGTTCALIALAAFAGATAVANIERFYALQNCRLIQNQCLVGCGYIIA